MLASIVWEKIIRVQALDFKSILLIILVSVAIPFTYSNAGNHKSTQQHPLNKAERIEKIENFLNSIKTFKASFEQSDQDNNIRKGEFYLVRPNKMRFDYLNPQKESIILDEDFLIHFNQELNEINYISASSFPVGFLSKDNIDLKADTKILEVTDLDHSMSIELMFVSEEKAPPKKIILEFSKSPMNLIGFYLQEDSGQTTRITLKDTILNQPIEDTRFEVK